MDDRIRNGSSGFLCQKADAGDMMWENAVNNAGTVTTSGSTKSISSMRIRVALSPRKNSRRCGNGE